MTVREILEILGQPEIDPDAEVTTGMTSVSEYVTPIYAIYQVEVDGETKIILDVEKRAPSYEIGEQELYDLA